MEPSNDAMAAAAGAGLGIGMLIFQLAILLLIVISLWKIFEKAGQPGWAAIVPIYNLVVMIQIAGKPMWWIIMLLIPFVNIIFAIMIINGISNAFGQGVGFTIGLLLLGIVFYPILAFGDYKYQGNASSPEPTSSAG